MSEGAKNKYSQDHIDSFKTKVGSSTWSFLHTMAAQYPKNPTDRQKGLMKGLIDGIAEFYPCPTCAIDFREKIKQSPPKLENNRELSVWFCDRHNEVNVKLGKKKFDCDKVWIKWGGGGEDGCGKLCDDVLGHDKVKMMEELLRK